MPPSPRLILLREQSVHTRDDLSAEALSFTLKDREISDLPCLEQGLVGDFTEIASLLRRIGEAQNLFHGKEVHAQLRRRGYDYSTFIGNSLVQMYGKCGSIQDARAAFHTIRSKNLHSWNILIQAYALNGHFYDAAIDFEAMPKRNVVSWTAIISAASQLGYSVKSMDYFHRMQIEGIIPNHITYVSVLGACHILKQGCEIHKGLVMRGFETDVLVATALLSMYGKCQSLLDAKCIFDTMPEKNIVAWTALIYALAQMGQVEESLELICVVKKNDVLHDKVIYICALNAVGELGVLEESQEVHASIVNNGFEKDTSVNNALLTVYGKASDLSSAICVFEKMMKKDEVSYSAIIAACAQNGHVTEALNFFYVMKEEGFQPQTSTFISVLDACAVAIALEQGREAHLALVKVGWEGGLCIGNSLVNLYGNCGSLNDAWSVFATMPQWDHLSWNGLISVCAQNGVGMEGFERLERVWYEVIEPNEATFLCAIEARAHAAVFNGGYSLFWKAFLTVCSLEMEALGFPCCDDERDSYASTIVGQDLRCTAGFYTSVIDHLGRAGCLQEAEDLVNSIKNLRDVTAPWSSLLLSSVLHGNVERGERVASRWLELEPDNASPYLELTKMYSEAGWWKNAERAREVVENFTGPNSIRSF